MSTSAVGLVVDTSGKGLPKLRVMLHDVSQQFEVRLAEATTGPAGSYSFPAYDDYIADSSRPGRQVRQLRLRVMLGRHVLKELSFVDQSAVAQLALPQITLTTEEATGIWATLGTGAPSRKTEGNAVRWLVDNVDAWGRTAEVIRRAQTLDILQLSISVAPFKGEAAKEQPIVVLDGLGADPPADGTKAIAVASRQRIERMILDAHPDVAAGSPGAIQVRVQTPKPSLDKKALALVGTATLLGLTTLLVLGGLMATLLVFGGLALAALIFLGVKWDAIHSFFSGGTNFGRWMAAADAARPGRLPVRVNELHMRAIQFTHSKLVIDRGNEVIMLGSPFGQHYFDSLHHVIDDPRRGGSASKAPIHEVSVGVRGPAVHDLQEVFNVHWNLGAPDDKLVLPAQRPAAIVTPAAGEFICSAQVVRTLDRMFDPPGAPATSDGEKGVLEAYLRAIHFAERFVYCENQYFNNDQITQALIDALAARPGLVVILYLNAVPDMPLYLGWQQQAIERIAASLKTDADRRRFGVFTGWTHAGKDAAHAKPRLVDIYLHTKTAIVDNRWATVGSANLDGASLDFIQYARPALDGDVLNSEANLVVVEEAPAQPVAVDALRRRLWSEHLGIADPRSTLLDDAPAKDWLAVWRDAAERKRTGLENNLDSVFALEGRSAKQPIQTHVLAWPKHAFFNSRHALKRHQNHRVAREYLSHLFSPDEKPSEVLVSQFDVLGEEGPPSIAFKALP